ncbi:MAG: universal stress protein [Gammaproteobacteria bacterium]|nr:universal stress protein [Gammaproteobacteria bacterium]
MTPATEQHTTRHVVVTLDASESGRPALETAVRLAALTGAHLEGVFVEDINLIRLAELPFLRELRPSSLAEEAISSQRMQRELRSLARRARRMLEQAAVEMGVHWSFQVWRGHAGAETLAETFSADILSLGRVSSLRFSGTWSAGGLRARRRSESPSQINVLFSNSKQAVRALTTACRLANDLGAPLSVILPEKRKADLQQLRQKALTILESCGQAARFVQLSGNSLQSLEQLTGISGQCILIAGSRHTLLQQAGLDRCLDTLTCPVLLVR